MVSNEQPLLFLCYVVTYIKIMSTLFVTILAIAAILAVFIVLWWVSRPLSSDVDYWLREAGLTNPVIMFTEYNATIGEATNRQGKRIRFGIYRFGDAVSVQEIALEYPGELLTETKFSRFPG